MRSNQPAAFPSQQYFPTMDPTSNFFYNATPVNFVSRGEELAIMSRKCPDENFGPKSIFIATRKYYGDIAISLFFFLIGPRSGQFGGGKSDAFLHRAQSFQPQKTNRVLFCMGFPLSIFIQCLGSEQKKLRKKYAKCGRRTDPPCWGLATHDSWGGGVEGSEQENF